MTGSANLRFEIAFRDEHAGWFDCFLTFAGERHRLAASYVFPPFVPLLNLLTMITAQRLPYKFSWDEEGHGAQFEAWPLAVDGSSFRLLIQHSHEDAPWVDAVLDRKEVVEAFLAPLEDFALHHRFFSLP